MNSSPPSLATVSLSRTALEMRAATSLSSSSPVACPKRSFTPLKPSTSRNISATIPQLRLARTRAFSRRSANSVRLIRPVSGS